MNTVLINYGGMNRVLNWKRGKKSPLHYSLIKSKLEGIPIRANLKYDDSPIMDQGATSACTSFAIAAAVDFLQLKALKAKQLNSPEVFGPSFMSISQLFIYYNERRMEGTTWQDMGAYIYDGVQSVQTTGMCQETLWPFNPNKITVTPPQSAYDQAKNHKAVTAYSITSLEDIKNSIAAGYPVVFGVDVCQSFVNIKANGVYAGPSRSERALGGHAMMIVAYDDHYQSLTIRNSWGKDFGDKGYCYANYSWADQFDDMHTIR